MYSEGFLVPSMGAASSPDGPERLSRNITAQSVPYPKGGHTLSKALSEPFLPQLAKLV